MDKTAKTKATIILLGVCLSCLGVYLTFSLKLPGYSLVFSTIALSGFAIVSFGFRYKPSEGREKIRIRTNAERVEYFKSASGFTGLIGIILFFSGLGLLLFFNYIRVSQLFAVSVVAMIVGFLLVFSARIIRIADSSKKRM
jgi:hypothetical protein